jgi:MSHA biogenesis protein MshJ
VRTLVEEMLGRDRKVTLVGMKTVAASAVAELRSAADSDPGATARTAAAPAKPAVQPAAGPALAAQRSIFRHGVELTMSGSYLDLLAYLSELEKLPTQLYWGGAELKAGTHPLVTMKLKLFTLSLDKAWMNV